MTDKEYAQFCDEYRDLIQTYSNHFERLKENWREVTGRECPFDCNKLAGISEEAIEDLRWASRDITGAIILKKVMFDYLN
jgi:hypothetical protein